MAALTPTILAKEGDSIRVAWFRVRNVDSGDTIALSTWFTRIHAAAAFNATRSLAYFAPSISTTTLTLTEASMSDDVCYVMVIGAGAAS